MPLSPLTAIVNKGKSAGYGDDPDVARYHCPDPVYTSVHIIRDAQPGERHYSPLHTHPFPELNILAAPPGELVFRITIGEEEHEVESPATVLIPAGVKHSANLVRGSGAFVVVRLMPDQLPEI